LGLGRLPFGWLGRIVCLVFLLTGFGVIEAAEDRGDAKKPATVAEAKRVLDLTTFPAMNGAKEPVNRSLARLSYVVQADCQAAYDFHRQTLTGMKWNELPGSTVTKEYGSGMFARDGFLASLAVSPLGDPNQPGMLSVMLTLHGNVDLAKLPVPAGLKPVYVGPQIAMYNTDAPVADTAEECRKLLMAQGWQPYGEAGSTLFFKQNAIRLTASIASAPGQGGKTSVSLSAEQLSADLPAPADTVRLQYADSTKQVSFDTKESEDAVVGFYRDTLGGGGWKATTDNTLKIGWKNVLIFRNAARDMLTLETYHVKADDVLRVSLKHQSAAEVAEQDERLDAQMAAAKAKQQAPLAKVAVALPPGAKLTGQTPSRLEFTVSPAQAKAVAESLRKTFRDAAGRKKSSWPTARSARSRTPKTARNCRSVTSTPDLPRPNLRSARRAPSWKRPGTDRTRLK
jgi:hypothetical protein